MPLRPASSGSLSLLTPRKEREPGARERFQLLNEPASQRTLSQAKIARNYDWQRIEVEEKRVKDERRQVAKAIAKQNPLSLTIAWFRMFESRRDAASVSRKLARPP